LTPGRPDAHHPARVPAQHAVPAAPVPEVEDEQQAAERAHPLQRLPVQEHVSVRIHRIVR